MIDRLDGKPQSWLAREAGLDTSTLSDILSKAMPKADSAMRIAAALGTTVEWLLTGETARKARLFDANDHSWIMVPRYDPRLFDESGKGEPIETYPIMLDWLNRHARSSKDLWVTEMPAHHLQGNVPEEGDTIICRDVTLREGLGTFLYLFDGAPIVRRFVLPDPPRYDPAVGEARPTSWDLGAPENDPPGMRVVARILGALKLQGA